MSWQADVPFPAENLQPCKGCGVSIGWIDRETKEGERKAHPVEAKGWAGTQVVKRPPGGKSGYLLTGQYANVAEPMPGTPGNELTVIFETHFAFCPKAHRFGRR